MSHFSSSLCHPSWILVFCKIFRPIARQNISFPSGEIFCIWTHGNNIFFPVKRGNNGETIFIWTAPKINYWRSNQISQSTFISYATAKRSLSAFARIIYFLYLHIFIPTYIFYTYKFFIPFNQNRMLTKAFFES